MPHSIILSVKNVKIRKKEMVLAIVLAVFVATFAAYTNIPAKEPRFGTPLEPNFKALGDTFSDETDQRVTVRRDTIEGELTKGKFETVATQLASLTEESNGFVSSQYMTYGDGLWTGEMVSKVPQENTRAFVFATRAIIDANGKVIYITTSITEVTGEYDGEEAPYATITITLKETSGAETPGPIAQILSIVPWLVTGLVWIAEGLIIGVPLCFASLGVVLLVDRGILPVWKKQLRKPQSQ